VTTLETDVHMSADGLLVLSHDPGAQQRGDQRMAFHGRSMPRAAARRRYRSSLTHGRIEA
jgi:glycerophosphoryl diester phosphodiesterase